MSISMDGLTSSLYSQVKNTDKASGMEAELNSKDYSNASDDELMKVCREFESYFMEQMFKNMEKMVPKEEAESQYAQSLRDYYEDEMVKKYTSQVVDKGQGLGLAQKLYEQMKRNYDIQ